MSYGPDYDTKEDYEEDLKEAQEAVAFAQRSVESALRWLKEVEGRRPPFEAGQQVRPKGNRVGVGTIVAMDKAFGQWLAMVSFGASSKPYTYPASELEVYE